MPTTPNKGYYIPDLNTDRFVSEFLPGFTRNFQQLDLETGGTGGGGSSTGKVIQADNTGDTMAQEAIQAALTLANDGDTLIFPPGRYWVEKNMGLDDFPNNDQPAVLLRGKKRVYIIGYGATLFTRTHAQGVFEMQLCEGVTIEGLKVEGYGSFPAIDTTTGYGEKGTSAGGYNTSGFWNYRKNNSYDTTARTTGSGAAWGTFGGGFIGNVGSGFLVHRGCKNIIFRNCEASGFNYSGFQVGHLGDYSPTELGYADNSDITFFNCYGHDNYSSNFVFSAVDRPRVIACLSERAGHPNASKTHTYVDPGYGVNSLGTNYGKANDLLVTGSTFRGNKRKAIDGHAGGGLIATDNAISDSIIGGIFYVHTNATQSAKDCIISNNKIVNCGYGVNPLGGIYLGGTQGGTKAEQETNFIITGNHVKKCFGTYGVIFVGAFDRLNISDNLVQGVPDQLNTALTTFKPYGIYAGYSVPTQPNFSAVVANNIVDMEHTGITGGILVRNAQEGAVTGNVVKIPHTSVIFGLWLQNCIDVGATGNTVKLGTVGEPLKLETRGVAMANTLTGGNAAFTPLQGQPIAFRVTGNSGNGSVIYKAGEQFISSIVSNTNGLEIILKNVPPGTTPMVKVSQAGSGGLLASTTVIDFWYIRQATATSVIVGLKATPTAGHTQFVNVTGGGLDIEITI